MTVEIRDPRVAAEIRAALTIYVAGIRRAGGRAPDLERIAAQLGELATGTPPARRPAKPWLSIRETATELGVSERTVRRAIDRGELPHRRVGRRVLIDREAVT